MRKRESELPASHLPQHRPLPLPHTPLPLLPLLLSLHAFLMFVTMAQRERYTNHLYISISLSHSPIHSHLLQCLQRCVLLQRLREIFCSCFLNFIVFQAAHEWKKKKKSQNESHPYPIYCTISPLSPSHLLSLSSTFPTRIIISIEENDKTIYNLRQYLCTLIYNYPGRQFYTYPLQLRSQDFS